MDNKRTSIGGLWMNTFTNKGGEQEKYGSQIIEINGQKFSFVMFKNKNKTKSTQPDYIVYLSVPKEQPAEKEPQLEKEFEEELAYGL